MLSHEQLTSTYAYTEIVSLHDLEQSVQTDEVQKQEDLALVSMTLQFDDKEAAEVSTRYFLENVRELVRKTDDVFLLGTTFYFVLPGANQEGAAIVQERLWDALLWRVHNCERLDITRPIGMKSAKSAVKVHSLSPSQTLWNQLCATLEERRYFQFNADDTQPEPRAMQMHDDEALSQLAREIGVPYLPTLPHALPAHVRQLVDERLARELHCCPLGREHNVLTVAMANPQDEVTLRRLQHITGLTIYPVLTSIQALQRIQ
ncbi:hypothetical protein [Ktedonospora formicarum]|uniref:Type II secretion system protein GspE N-terminal domain-containing protein n=1 Tax=Ktedonospora formicarum TaxID=2778364 RepID=A0A8J3MSN6_9CHLR|nr:hypothetical protein [Ktedonospora formicarum]GHO44803.1 hypothetical protein KSX_29660 [Ktedonospora formicarum]